MSRSRMLIGAAVAAAALAGCGSSGPSLSAFKSGFQADKAQFTQLGRDMATAVNSARGKSNAQLGAEFTALASRTSQQAAQLQKLKPPSKYKSQLDQLVSGFRTVAADLMSIATNARAGSATGAQSASSKLVQDTAQVRSVDRALTAGLGLPQSS